MKNTTPPQRLCPITGEPLPQDRYISKRAARALQDALTQFPTAWLELQKIVTRQVNTAPGKSGGGHPLPFNLAASDVAHETRNAFNQCLRIATRARLCKKTKEPPAAYWYRWITQQLLAITPALATNPAGSGITVIILHHIAKIKDTLTPPPSDKFYGRCEATWVDGATCGGYLYAPPDIDAVTCARCKNTYNTRELAEYFQQQIRDKLATPKEIEYLLSHCNLQRKITADTIRYWGRTGRISKKQNSPQQLYKIGDILEIIS